MIVTNNIDAREDFGIEVVAQGAFLDKDPGRSTDFIVQTVVFRLSSLALKEYLDSTGAWRGDYDTEAEYREEEKKRNELRKAWRNKIAECLGCDAGHMDISRNLTEIFTAIIFNKVPKVEVF